MALSFWRTWVGKPPTRRPKQASDRLCLEPLEDRTLPSFVLAGSFPVGDPATEGHPINSVVGDFNGDGKLDLATAHVNTESVSVLLGNGNGTFAPQLTFAAGAFPVSLAVGDFDGDDRLDLAEITDTHFPKTSGWVGLLLGNGDGTLQRATTFARVLLPEALTVGDFNRDGKLDLAVVTTLQGPDGVGHDAVSVFLGNGNGTFLPEATNSAGPFPVAIAVADFTGDGKLDVALANVNGATVGILVGNGDGTFQNQVTFAAGPDPEGIVAGDFNGDGKQDLAVPNTYPVNTVSVLLGNGDGTFAPRMSFATGTNPTSIAVGDFNRDGKLDLTVTRRGSPGSVGVLLGNGDGTFVALTTYPTGPVAQSVTVGDFNGDGAPDLAVSAGDSVGVVSILLNTFPNSGTGTFAAAHTFATSPVPHSVAAGDFNGDGKTDVAAAFYSGSPVHGGISVFLGNGNGTFAPETTSAAGPMPLSMVVGDFNRDGKLDLATVDPNPGGISLVGNVGVLLGNGNGTFAPQITFATGANPATLALGDFNGDGKLDLVVENSLPGSPSVSVLLGNGEGTLQPQLTFAVASSFAFMTVGDFNGDGKLDLALPQPNTGNVQTPGFVSILLGNGNGTFALTSTFTSGGYTEAVVAGDFDGDGKLDLAVSNQTYHLPPSIRVLHGNGDGTFGQPVTLATTQSAFALAVADFNGDGKLDLAVNNAAGFAGGNSVGVYLGNGDGTFGPQTNFPTNIFQRYRALAVGDFNGDGAPDLVVAGADYPGPPGVVSVLLSQPAAPNVIVTGANAGGGPNVAVFDAVTDARLLNFFAYDPNFTGGVRVALGDVTGDGVPDIITAPGPGGGPDIHIYDGHDGHFIRNFFAFDPGFTGGVYVAAGDVNGDGRADIICGADAGGGPNVTVFSGLDGEEILSFFPYDPAFTGGVRVAAGDVDGNGIADIVTGAGAGGGPNVTVYKFVLGQAQMLQSYFAFDPRFTAGVYVAAGDVNGDLRADVVVGAGAGGGPHVAVFNGANGAVLASFFAYDPLFTGGVRVGTIAAVNAANVLAVPGPGGGPQVRKLNGLSGAVLDAFFAYDPAFTGGVFIAGGG